MSDPIVDGIIGQAPAGLFGEAQEPQPDKLYGEGVWKGAELKEVVTYPISEHGFGYRIGLVCTLKEGMDYTAKFDLERTLTPNGHDIEGWMEDREAKKRKFLNDALQAVGFNRPVEQAIDTEEQYEAIVNIFRQSVGRTFDIKVVPDGKNTFTADENGTATNREGVKGTWTFEGNGYTKAAWIKASRKPRK